MSGVGFLTSKDKSVTKNISDNHPSDVYFFNFCLSLNPHTIDPRASNAIYQFELSLRLPHNFPSSSVNFLVSRPSVITIQFQELRLMQPSVNCRISCRTGCQQLRYGIYFWLDMNPFPLHTFLPHCVL